MVLFRITENEPSKMHNVRPYVYSRPCPMAFTLNSMIFSQLRENYLFKILNMEFCKIPNFGTVTMKHQILVTMATIMIQKKNPHCKQKKLVLTFLPNIEIQRFSVETINNIITLLGRLIAKH